MRRTRARRTCCCARRPRPGSTWRGPREILAGDEYAEQVRERERFYQEQGIHSVPSVIIDDRHLIQGGQPPEAFERALRQLAAQA